MLHFFARRMKEAREDQRGFTLIELLVVVIIIGILAAIAIPTFLAQRDNAQEAAAKSDLRNAAGASQACAADADGDFTACHTAVQLKPFGFNPSEGVVYTPAAAPSADFFAATAKAVSGTVYSYTGDPANADSGKVTG